MNQTLPAPSIPTCPMDSWTPERRECYACGLIADGYQSMRLPDVAAPAFICLRCAEELVTAYVASSPGLRLIRVETFEVPVAPLPDPPENVSTGDISIQITFNPDDDPRSVDIQVSPEPQSGGAALDLIEMALFRGADYLGSYKSAAADDGDEEVAS